MSPSTTDAMGEARPLGAQDRKELVLRLAARSGGTTPGEAHAEAVKLGDTVTEEAYYNLARRLAHRGLLVVEKGDGGLRYRAGAPADKQWLEEDELSAMVDPDYPLIALTVWRESWRQVNSLPETVWVELRERLKTTPARRLFFDAIVSYGSHLHAQVGELVSLEQARAPELVTARQEADNSRQQLVRLTKYGLGLSCEAVGIPQSIKEAVSTYHVDKPYVDEDLLRSELEGRIADEPFVLEAERDTPGARPPLVGAVDGSTRSGLLSFMGEEGDMGIGHAPLIAINTSVGLVNRHLARGADGRRTPAFLRLPERPEDTQRQENRYTVMAKLLYPDLGDAEYMHAVWNAMDLLEARAALRLLNPWPLPRTSLDVPAADVVLRDGTVSPQDRDFHHYADDSTYGRIVRDMIQTHWDLALKAREGEHAVAGVVKMAQLSVLAPVLNWYAAQLAASRTSQITAWPMQSLNLAPDQLLVTRLLTAGRGKGEPWYRTCVVLRPFHALTNYGALYSRRQSPSQTILEEHRDSQVHPERVGGSRKVFWDSFRPDSDPYLKLLDNVLYGSVFLAAVGRLDGPQSLPRLEFLVVSPTAHDAEPPWEKALAALRRVLHGIRETGGFDVAAEHQMFTDPPKIDVLPRIIVDVHNIVKLWAANLLGRVQEFVGYQLSRYVRGKRYQGIKVRPFDRHELEILLEQLRRERELRAGADAETADTDAQ